MALYGDNWEDLGWEQQRRHFLKHGLSGTPFGTIDEYINYRMEGEPKPTGITSEQPITPPVRQTISPVGTMTPRQADVKSESTGSLYTGEFTPPKINTEPVRYRRSDISADNIRGKTSGYVATMPDGEEVELTVQQYHDMKITHPMSGNVTRTK